MPTLRQIRRWLVAGLLGLAGCLRVDPTADYARTRELIRDRVGDVEVFDPATEPMVAARVADLLADSLTLDEAVKVALLANRPLQARFADLGAARADVVQSRLLSNPSFSVLARFPEGGGRSSIMMGLGQELVDLWQIPVRRQIAGEKLDSVVFDIARQAIDLTAEVKTRCHRVQALKWTEARVHDNIALIERSYSLAEARFRAGETGLLDMNLVKSDLLEAQLELIAVRRDRRVADTELARVLGLARWPTPWTLADEPATIPTAVETDETLLLTAMQQRLDAQSAARNVAAAEGDLERQWLNIFPNVRMGVDGERMARRALPGRDIAADTARASIRSGQLTAPEIMSKGQRDQMRRQMIDTLLGPSLAITLPIYDQNQAQIAKAGYMVEQRRTEYEALLDQVAQEVQSTAAIVRAAKELVDFYERQSLPQADTTLDAASRSYEAGEGNVLALIEAQGLVIRLQREAIAARRDRAIALAELERAVGGRLPGPGDVAGPSPEATSVEPANGGSYKPDQDPNPSALPEALIEQPARQ